MSEWSSVKLKEVINLRRKSITIDDPSEYKLCRVQLHRKGIVLRETQFGHQIKTKKQQVCKTGDLVVAEMDAKFGGYGFIPPDLDGAIVSSHYYLYELDEKKILQDYFQVLIASDFIQNQIEAKGSTNYSSIRAWEFLEYEIPLPSLSQQRNIAKRFTTFSDFNGKLSKEHGQQSDYYSLLRQAILQEAIEGKLTADWRKKNPVRKGDTRTDAAALLEKIRDEKHKMIAEGKIRKDKPLKPITEKEIPFKLPEGWVWCRLGDIADSCLGKMLDGRKNQGEPRPYLRNLNVRWFSFDLTDLKLIKVQDHELVKCSARKGDLLICEGGYPGRGAIWDSHDSVVIQKAIHRVRFFIEEHNVWFLNFLSLLDMNRGIEHYFTGSGIQHLTGEKLKTIVLPLPPLTEQQSIMKRVDHLLAIVGDLEKQVTERKGQAEDLMQTVLREAFEGKN